MLKTTSATVCPSAPIDTPWKTVPSARAKIAGGRALEALCLEALSLEALPLEALALEALALEALALEALALAFFSSISWNILGSTINPGVKISKQTLEV